MKYSLFLDLEIRGDTINSKSFLLGLGTGVILATFTLMVVYINLPKEVMTDEEITEAARQLGLRPVKEILSEEGLKETVTVSDDEIIARAKELGLIEPHTTSEAVGQLEWAFVTIPPGTPASQVAVLLYDAGIIEDTEDFAQFLYDQGITRRLRSGMIEIPKGLSYEQILEYIVP